MAGERGFEPRLTDPKTVVLPLDDSPAWEVHVSDNGQECNGFGQFGQGCIVQPMQPSRQSLPRIVFAEDNLDHAFLIRRVLEPHCQLTYASDGEQLLETLNQWMHELPRLVLIDVNLPRLSGLEVLECLRAKSDWRTVPMVVFSTSKLRLEVERALNAGANSFVVKPAKFTEFREVLERVVLYWTQIHAGFDS
jgi:CheY-like chemotaxis protein